MSESIAKQIKFVKWLKSKGIYSQFDSAQVMRVKQEVWEAMSSVRINVVKRNKSCLYYLIRGES